MEIDMIFEMTTENQTIVKDMLHANCPAGVRIVFTKVDGSEREMYCTLNEKYIPGDKLPKEGSKGRAVSETSCAVFDLDKRDWRSFRWDSLKIVNFGV